MPVMQQDLASHPARQEIGESPHPHLVVQIPKQAVQMRVQRVAEIKPDSGHESPSPAQAFADPGKLAKVEQHPIE